MGWCRVLERAEVCILESADLTKARIIDCLLDIAQV